MEQGDAFFDERKVAGNAARALEIYSAISPQNFESLWRESMACQYLGHRVATANDSKRDYFARGVRAGRDALALNPNCAPCYFWTSINLALLGKLIGPLQSLRSLKEIRQWLEKARELDPNYAQGGPDRVLGTIEAALPKIIGGDRIKARHHFESSLTIAPEEPMNYLALAKLWEENYGNRTKALAVAREGLAHPPPQPNQIESIESRDELNQLVLRLSASL